MYVPGALASCTVQPPSVPFDRAHIRSYMVEKLSSGNIVTTSIGTSRQRPKMESFSCSVCVCVGLQIVCLGGLIYNDTDLDHGPIQAGIFGALIRSARSSAG